MKKSLITVFLLGILSFNTSAQVFKGRVTSESGQPVPFATIYIQELKFGTASNAEGEFEIRLPSGSYTVNCQSLGYEPVIETLEISENDVTRHIILPEQVYDIQEVRISHSGEDPATYIMRKTIGLAPYYLNFINYYKADVYLKGNLHIRKIPRFLERSMRMSSSGSNVGISAGRRSRDGQQPTVKEGDTYFMESFNEIEFTAPDKYLQKVVSFNSSFPAQEGEISPMSYIQASFYQPVLADMAISPLSPRAFSHYNFRYLGATLQGDYTVNKIEVLPKRKSQQLFKGTIYIIQDLWCIHSLDLTNENLAGDIRINELYIPVDEDIWMPVSHQFDVNINMFGFKATAGYTSSVKYVDFALNTKLQKPGDIYAETRESPDNQDTVKSGVTREIERLIGKEELSNREMARLSKLMKKEASGSRPDSTRGLEIKDNTVRIIEKDAAGKDSTYWAMIRPIPLSDIEMKSLYRSDSIKTIQEKEAKTSPDSISTTPGKRQGSRSRPVNQLLFGKRWSDTSGFSLEFDGLANLNKLSFNPVDGFIWGTAFRIRKRYENNNSLALYPDIRYAFSRKSLMWRLNVNYSVTGNHPGQYYVRAGMASRDIGTNGGVNLFINSLSSLILKKNYLKLYDSRYLTLGYGTSLTNWLRLELSGGYENRKALGNSTSFSIFRNDREYLPNIPEIDDPRPGESQSVTPRDMKHFEFAANFSFTPLQKYRMINGTRIPQGSDWPEIKLTWKHGLNQDPHDADVFRHYDMFMLEAIHNLETGAFSRIAWNIRSGGFIDNRNISYYDFFHFNAQPLPILLNDYSDSYMIPMFYTLSTPCFFTEAHLKYTDPYIFLKLLPGISNTLIRENLSFSYLGTRYRPHYFEFGYSLSEIFLLAEAGVYFGFDNMKFRAIGLKITLNLN